MAGEIVWFDKLSKIANMRKMLNVIRTFIFTPKIGIRNGVLKYIVLP